jgi:5-methylcytosine-specific restriction endonuclease McrA
MKKSALKRGNSVLKRTPLKKVSLNKKKYSKKRMIYGIRVWSLTVADSYFSKWLREQRNYICEMCGNTEKEKMQCSHYIGRAEKATRYDPDNCDCLCWSCHSKMEDRKQYEYRDWKIAKMGEKEHNQLKLKQKTSLGEKDAIYNCMKLLGKV